MKMKLAATISILLVLAMFQAQVASAPENGWKQNGLITQFNEKSYLVDPSVLVNEHAFIWSKTTGMQDLGTLPGGNYSFAFDINNLGKVAGYSQNATGNIHAVVWNKVGMTYVPTDLGTLPGETYSFAFGINDLGQVVGGPITVL